MGTEQHWSTNRQWNLLRLLRKVTAGLHALFSHRSAREIQSERLAQEIVEYGRVNSIAREIIEYGRMNRDGPGDILIDVREASFRLRESPRDVRQALRLLEMRGIAEKTNFKDLWTLRLSKLGEGDPPAASKAG